MAGALLIDLEPQTEQTKLALKDGIVTVHEYQAWLLGYLTGTKESTQIIFGEKYGK